LILGDNLLFIYFGWEGVGLCSYLLIGFYYSNRNNGNAALKAFIVTRIGDVFMAIGLFILFQQLGTLNIQELMVRAPEHFKAGDFWIVAATLMLLGGAVGKSAQLPLQTWLADAMAGPTPVSALIHAATMVTAGVYLIARTHGLFALAPDILHLVGIVGGVTLVLAGFAALVQTDIKRILAYSTMSQIGYMFLALGVGAWEGAIFHLMTHAFFKALLFLASGAVIVGCHHEQNIFKMGGLWKKLPLAYACFIVGGAALSALPILTVGFYSKDEILWEAFASGHTYLLYAGLVGAFMTSIYTFRLIFIAFHGEAKTDAHPGHGISHWLPLGVLIVLSTFVGAWIHPPLAGVLPESVGHAGGEAKHSLEIASGAIALAGILLAALLFLGKRRVATAIANSGPGRVLSAWWFAAWGFDWIYDKLFVKPYLGISHLLRKDPVDRTIGLIPRMAKGGNTAMSRTETGQLRWYAASIVAGAVLVLGAVVLASV
ncbi:NADH-quinone oxidoreductase subunit L, partial [Pseudomonas sp.]|uniref:NADH-quinone oxidoreductase subunit L n=1 Tax=Pseudomonas sp. TaxID=306 RepID=UPI00258B9839